MPRPADPPRLILRQQADRPPVWQIIWSEAGRRRRRSTGTGDRRQADRILQAFRAEIKPELASRAIDEILIADLLDRYAETAAARTEAPERIGYAIRRLAPFWAEFSPLDITETKAREYRAARQADGAQDGTIRRELGVLSAALGQGVDDRLFPAAPKVWIPPRPEGRKPWLTRDEIAQLIREARKEYRMRAHMPWFILIGFYMGGRSTAILKLKWRPSTDGGDVDLASGLIDFNPQGHAQSNKRRALAPMPPNLHLLLRLLAKRGHDTVISGRSGQPISSIKKGFKTIAARAGVPWATAHTLRHSCITHLLINGVSRYDVSTWAKISLSELERTYGHHAPEYLDDARQSWRRSRAKAG